MCQGRLYLVRHGRTASNVEGRRLGREDVPLDDVGRAQARELAAALAGERIDAVYTSPLTRARDTAATVAGDRDLVVLVDADLLEFDYGDVAGSVRAQTKVRLRCDHLRTPVAGGESLLDVWHRVQRFAARLAAEFPPRGRILVVGHRRTNRMLVGHLRGLTLEQTAASDDYRQQPGQLVGYDVAVVAGALRVSDASG